MDEILATWPTCTEWMSWATEAQYEGGGGGVTVEGRTYGTLQEDGRGRWRDRMEND